MKFSLIVSIALCICLTQCGAPQNKYVSLLSSIVKQLSAKPDHIEECLIPEYKLDKSQDFIKAENEFNNSQQTFRLINKFLNKDIDEKCLNMKEMYEYYVEKHKIDSNKLKSKFLQIAMRTNPSSSDRKGKKGKNVTKNEPKGKGKSQNKKFGSFDEIYPIMDKISVAFKNIMTTPLFENILKFLECYKNAHGINPASKKKS